MQFEPIEYANRETAVIILNSEQKAIGVARITHNFETPRECATLRLLRRTNRDFPLAPTDQQPYEPLVSGPMHIVKSTSLLQVLHASP